MRLRSSLLSFALASSTFFFSNVAIAGDAVVVPLYSPNLPTVKVGNITSLITSEVDFSGRYDMVFPADSRPKALTPKCLKSVSCLKPIADGEGVTSMVTGSVTKMGSELEFFVVLYENGKIIRMKRFRITDDPLSLAADVGSYIQEVVTGQEVEQEEEETLGTAPIAADVLDEEGDIFGGDEDPLGDFSLDPAEEERLAAQKAAEERARQEEDRRAEEEQRRKEMEEQARRLAMEAEAKRLASQAMEDDAGEEDFDFNFAPSTVEVVEEEKEDNDMDFSFDEPKPTREKSKSKDKSRSKEKSKPKTEYKPSTDYNTPSSRTKRSSSVRSGRIDAAATLTGKVGGGNFQTLNFVTYGGEIGIHLSDAVSVHIGGEGYATNQAMPVLDEDGEPTDVLQQSWRVLIPVSLGVEYHFEGKMAKPYVGADMQILPAYAGTGSGAAIGLRGRAGSNFMVADGFGINLNVAFGFWSGQYFRQVPSPAGGTLNPSGLAPQITLGPVIAF